MNLDKYIYPNLLRLPPQPVFKAIVIKNGKDIHYFYNCNLVDAFYRIAKGLTYKLDGGFKWVKTFEPFDPIENYKVNIEFYY